MNEDRIRIALGTIDLGGFERIHPLPAGVLVYEGVRPTELVAHRIEGGDHEAGLVIELGPRAYSWLDQV